MTANLLVKKSILKLYKVPFFRYILVGAINNGLAYCLFLVIYEITALKYLASTLAFIAALISSFFFHRTYSFQSKLSKRSTIPRYCIVYLWGYFSSLFFLALLSKYIFSVEISQFLSMLIVALELYLLNRYIVFTDLP